MPSRQGAAGGVTKYQPERKQPGILAARAGYSIRWSQIAKKQMIRYGVRTLNSRQRLCQWKAFCVIFQPSSVRSNVKMSDIWTLFPASCPETSRTSRWTSALVNPIEQCLDRIRHDTARIVSKDGRVLVKPWPHHVTVTEPHAIDVALHGFHYGDVRVRHYIHGLSRLL